MLQSVAVQVREILGADLRSLALFRIVLALMVLLDIAGRIPYLDIFYSASGIVPRSLIIDELSPWRWSLNFMAGAGLFQAVLLDLTILAAIGMLLGYRTRWMTFIVWVLVFSVQTRNPAILSAADTLIRDLLFWSILLPLGAYWSLDSRRAAYSGSRPTQILSIASVGLFAQISFMYVFTALLKTGDEWRSDGTALYYALHAQHLTRDFGEFLAQYDSLLKVLTFGSIGLEFLLPVLLFFPFRNGVMRMVGIVLAVVFHLGIFMTMDLGLFSLISALAMTCFVPPWFWDRILPAVRSAAQRGLPRVYTVANGLAARLVSARARIVAWARTQRVSRRNNSVNEGQWPRFSFAGETADGTNGSAVRTTPLTNVFAAICLVIVFGWNVATVSSFAMPPVLRSVGLSLGLYQRWDMFAPRPAQSTVWYVYTGTLADGTEMNVLPAVVGGDMDVVSPVSWNMPADIPDDLYGSKYWRKYLDYIARGNRGEDRLVFASYICRSWNSHDAGTNRLTGIGMYRVFQRTLPQDQRGPVRKDLLGTYTCT